MKRSNRIAAVAANETNELPSSGVAIGSHAAPLRRRTPLSSSA
jgi:hypothetical protein